MDATLSSTCHVVVPVVQIEPVKKCYGWPRAWGFSFRWPGVCLICLVRVDVCPFNVRVVKLCFNLILISFAFQELRINPTMTPIKGHWNWNQTNPPFCFSSVTSGRLLNMRFSKLQPKRYNLKNQFHHSEKKGRKLIRQIVTERQSTFRFETGDSFRFRAGLIEEGKLTNNFPLTIDLFGGVWT